MPRLKDVQTNSSACARMFYAPLRTKQQSPLQHTAVHCNTTATMMQQHCAPRARHAFVHYNLLLPPPPLWFLLHPLLSPRCTLRARARQAPRRGSAPRSCHMCVETGWYVHRLCAQCILRVRACRAARRGSSLRSCPMCVKTGRCVCVCRRRMRDGTGGRAKESHRCQCACRR